MLQMMLYPLATGIGNCLGLTGAWRTSAASTKMRVTCGPLQRGLRVGSYRHLPLALCGGHGPPAHFVLHRRRYQRPDAPQLASMFRRRPLMNRLSLFRVSVGGGWARSPVHPLGLAGHSRRFAAFAPAAPRILVADGRCVHAAGVVVALAAGICNYFGLRALGGRPRSYAKARCMWSLGAKASCWS
jgi:hypothetical protein